MKNYVIALVLLLLSCTLAAQDVAPNASSSFSLVLPENVRSEMVQVYYFMSGAFGGYGSFLRPQPGLRAYELKTTPADNDPTAKDIKGTTREIKAIAYMPGCKFVTLDLRPGMPTEQPLECLPLPSVKLSGQIIPSDVLVGKTSVVEVSYLANWEHEFFGIMDGMVSTFRVATVRSDDTGAFTVSLPDLARDEVSTRWKYKGEWQFILREVGTGNIISRLSPTEPDAKGTGLSVRPSYPDVVNFAAVLK